MALFAISQRMGADQRKTVLMIANRIQRNLPSLYRVALLTGCPELAAVNVSVAIRALLADVGEHKIRVARRTGQLLMHSAQGILRVIVIELRNRADRLPTRTGVTCLTRHRERAMRIGNFGTRSGGSRASVVNRLLPRHAHQQWK